MFLKIYFVFEARKEKQLEKAKERGHKGIGVFRKVEDAVVNKVEDIGIDVEEGFSEAFEVLKEGKKEIMKLIINMSMHPSNYSIEFS
ncbi:hypothetical protein [Aquimarina muelleri]|uniref:Uncharacterized protein n=1 Tax=Aquimarina muelleri TaxID=279356 RepID=A0A918JYV9_9FLAO|nr:hypothetical protein [Aquimarina muelleri]GGX33058.1 hypothetical protein GCM10007384_37300 [Aquimarina muelleri]